ncbi:hypothetical protein [Desulfitibacter alkalitolerans]|uniref:hypothetical protein n=1 Tax=Desulfitibacter alkalitolerans TaxID=264641 RepID=UPI0012ECB4D0|nr:hypothetical protein [Desulfitibacter alkalitolerans]
MLPSKIIVTPGTSWFTTRQEGAQRINNTVRIHEYNEAGGVWHDLPLNYTPRKTF